MVGIPGACRRGLAELSGPGPNRFRSENLQGPHHRSAPTEVLVLGTMHLSGLDDDWDPATLEPVLQKLEGFAPDVIAIENIDGMTIEERWEHRAYRGSTAVRYGRETMLSAMAGRVGTGLGMAEAAQQARTLLEDWPDAPAPAERRKLAARLATAGDPYSALVQWWSLAPQERTAEDGVGDALRDRLDHLLSQRNESSLIAAHLAQRLGLNRLYPMDSQGEDVFTEAEFAVFVDEVFPAIGERLAANADIAEADKRVDDHADRAGSSGRLSHAERPAPLGPA